MADYYRILGVSPKATAEEIKQAYRRLVRQYHPDLNKEALDQHIKRLNEAYRVLGNMQRRAVYDALRLKEEERAAVEEELRRRREAAKMTWAEGVQGFIREFRTEVSKGTPSQSQEKKMSWAEGVKGFVEEFKKGLRDE